MLRIVAGGQFRIGNRRLNQPDTFLAFADQHRRLRVELGRDHIQKIIQAGQRLGNGGFIFRLAIQQTMNAVGKYLRTRNQGLRGNQAAGITCLQCHAAISFPGEGL